MNVTKYRFIIFIASSILAIVGGSIYMNYDGDISGLWATLGEPAIITAQSTIIQDQDVIRGTPILIQDIISKRYLYTLKKYIENELFIQTGTGIANPSEYQTFEKVTMSGSSFIFDLDAGSIEIPLSSYFFDIWNKKSKWTVSGEYNGAASGEISANTGITQQIHKKVIALTFDDGPSPKYTHILLDILKKEQVRSTFYVLGERAEEYPDIIRREYDEGHEIGNHSYSHALLSKLSQTLMQEELYKTDQAIYNAIHIYPKTFRPPYGGVNTGMLEKSAMPAVLWSIDPHDWKTLNKQKNIASIAHAKDGDIIIMHDIHEISVESIPEMIKSLKDQGFTFVTITELLGLSDENPEIGKICTKKGNCK